MSSSTDYMQTVASFPPSSPLTMMMWLRMPNTSGAFLGFGNATATNRMSWENESGSINFDNANDGGGRLKVNWSSYFNIWVRVTHVYNPGASFNGVYVNGNLISSGASLAAAPPAPGSPLTLGYWAGYGTRPPIDVADWIIWSRALSPGEIKRLYRDPWTGTTRRRMVVVAGGLSPITGTGAATLGALTSTGAGTLGITGAGAATLGALTGTGSGTLSITGAGNNTLGALVGSGGSTLAIAGTQGGTLGALTSAATGALGITGTVAATLGALTSTGSAALGITGGLAATLGALQCSSSDASATPAPASRTVTWLLASRDAVWPEESRDVTWPAQSRTVTWQE